MAEKRTKGVPDEVIIAALLQSGTIEKAAAAAGVSPRTVYDRMRTPEFKGLYAHAKAAVLRSAVNSITGKVSEAVETVAAIMHNEGVNPATRLQAAQTILNHAGKYSQLLTDAEKIADQESTPPDEKITELFL